MGRSVDSLPWLGDDESSEEEQEEDDEIVDETALYGDTLIEVGITSGADPSDWDSIDIDPED